MKRRHEDDVQLALIPGVKPVAVKPTAGPKPKRIGIITSVAVQGDGDGAKVTARDEKVLKPDGGAVVVNVDDAALNKHVAVWVQQANDATTLMAAYEAVTALLKDVYDLRGIKAFIEKGGKLKELADATGIDLRTLRRVKLFETLPLGIIEALDEKRIAPGTALKIAKRPDLFDRAVNFILTHDKMKAGDVEALTHTARKTAVKKIDLTLPMTVEVKTRQSEAEQIAAAHAQLDMLEVPRYESLANGKGRRALTLEGRIARLRRDLASK